MAGFTTNAVVTDPARTVSDTALAIERIVTTMEQANSSLMENVIGRLTDTKSALYDAAYSAWCTHQVAIERLTDISMILAEAEGPLADLANRGEV